MKNKTIISKAITESLFIPDFVILVDYNKDKTYHYKTIGEKLIPVNDKTFIDWKMIKDNYFSTLKVPDGNFLVVLYQFSNFSLSKPND